MHTRIASALILVVSLVGWLPAADPLRPQPLTERQVQSLSTGLADPLTQSAALKWCSRIKANNGELFDGIRACCKADDPQIRRLAAKAISPFGARAISDLIPLLKDSDPATRQAAAGALEVIGEQAAAAVSDLIPLLKDLDSGTRQSAVGALGGIGEKAAAAVPHLIPLLKDSDSDTRRAAADVLVEIGGRAAASVPDLIPLLKDSDSGIRRSAADVLARIGEKAVPNLIPLLKDSNSDIRQSAADVLARIGEEAIPDLIPLFKDSNSDIRQSAADVLDRLKEKTAAVPHLIPLLKDSNSGTPEAAARALGGIGAKAAAAVPHLIPLLKDVQRTIRQAAAKALGGIGEKAAAAIPDLIPLLKDPDSATRQAAAKALGGIGEKAAAAIPDLIHLLKNPGEYTREAAAGALFRIGEKAVPDLVPLLKDSNSDTRQVTANVLERIGEKAAAAIPDLIPLLKDSNYLTRRAAAGALRGIGQDAGVAVPHLIPLLMDFDPINCQVAAEVLVQFGEKAIPHLIPLLKDQWQPVRSEAAVKALGGMGEKAVPHLIPLLKDSNWGTHEAARALGGIGAKAAAAVPHLIPLLKDAQRTIRQAAAKALGGIGEKAAAAIPDLIPLLKDPDSATRQAAAKALGGIGEKAAAAIPDLIPLLKDKEWEVREAAAAALGEMGEKAATAVPHLIPLLKESIWTTRRAAAKALAGIRVKAAAAIPHLIPLLDDRDSDVRVAAAGALAGIREKATLPDLIPLLKDPDSGVRQIAAGALAGIREKATLPDLIPLLKDPDSHTRQAAAEDLGRIGEKAAAAVPDLIPLLKDPDSLTRQATATALSRIGESAAVPHMIPLLRDPTEVTRSIIRSFILNIDKSYNYISPHAVVVTLQSAEQTPYERAALSNWFRRHSQVGVADLCALLEMSNQGGEEQSERLLDAYLTVGESERPLVRWLGGRPKEMVPPLDSLNHDDRAVLLRQLTAFLPHTADTPRTRSEVARLMHAIVENTSWSQADLETLRDTQGQLRDAGMTAEADAAQKQVERLEWWRKWTDRLQATSIVWAGHVVFWVVLIVLYPRFRWVQAVFFWNPWVRTISGLVYVPWIITLVPFLRRRLLRPFQENLVPQRFAHEFQGDSYFADSQISTTWDGHLVTEYATEYLAPPLRGPQVIEAPSGFGKTTLLQWFVRQPGGPRVVLRATECDEGVMKAIQKLLYGIAADEKFLQTLVFAGGLDVIIDGLNEASPETRVQVTTFVNSLFRGNYLLTTQPLLGFKVPRAAEVWKLQPLAPDQVAAFLMQQWPRVEATAATNGVSQETYTTRAEELVKKAEKSDEPEPFGLSTPLDASLVADLLAQKVKPKLNNLVAQHVQLARDRFREISPAQEPGFDRVGERAVDQIRSNKPKLDLAGLEKECDALLQRKLLINHGDECEFRHDRVRDYFIALSVKSVEAALSLREDPRFTGVFEFLPETLDAEDANELGDKLKEEAADTGDKTVWAKYKPRWKQPRRPRGSKET